MKILFILPEYYPHSGGGISTYYLNYIKALKSSVGEIRVLIGSGYTQSDEAYSIDGISIEYLKPEIYNRYLPKFSKFDLQPEYRNNIAASWAMWEQANEGVCYDIVECTDFGLGFIPWLINHKLTVVVRLHGSSGQIDFFESFSCGLSADLHRQAELILLEKADKIISHSTKNKNYWGNVLSRSDIEVIYPVFERDAAEISYAEKEANGIVCARIQEWKGPDVLCEALAFIDTTDIRINWFGRDTRFNETLSKSAQLKIDYPKIWGEIVLPQMPLPPTEIASVQQKAKFAVIPSTWDMFNFTGLEYLNAGTVLICSDGAGVSELINDGVNGFVFRKNDSIELESCIKKVLTLSADDYKTIVAAGKLTLSTLLNSKAILNANLKLYSQLKVADYDVRSDVFTTEMFSPSEKAYPLDDTLSGISIKNLTKHLLNRIGKKF